MSSWEIRIERREVAWPDGWHGVLEREVRVCGACGGTATREVAWLGPPRTDGAVTVVVCAGCNPPPPVHVGWQDGDAPRFGADDPDWR